MRKRGYVKIGLSLFTKKKIYGIRQFFKAKRKTAAGNSRRPLQTVDKSKNRGIPTGEKCEKGAASPFFAFNSPPAGDEFLRVQEFAFSL
jgi:hypothetical protein